jgi:hypothetical protein
MTTSFEFESVKELQQFAENARDEICSCIVLSLSQALEEGEEEPVIFELSLKEGSDLYEMYLNRAEWNKALDTCLEFFTDNNYPDQAIDTYFLIQKINEREVG